MMLHSRLELRKEFPVSSGLFESGLWALAAAALTGLMGFTLLSWPLILFVIQGYRRPVSYQAALILPLAVFTAFLGHATPMQTVLPAAAALLAANMMVRTENGGRWGVEHCGFAVCSLFAYLLAALLVIDAIPVLWNTGFALVILLAVGFIRMGRLLGGILGGSAQDEIIVRRPLRDF